MRWPICLVLPRGSVIGASASKVGAPSWKEWSSWRNPTPSSDPRISRPNPGARHHWSDGAWVGLARVGGTNASSDFSRRGPNASIDSSPRTTRCSRLHTGHPSGRTIVSSVANGPDSPCRRAAMTRSALRHSPRPGGTPSSALPACLPQREGEHERHGGGPREMPGEVQRP